MDEFVIEKYKEIIKDISILLIVISLYVYTYNTNDSFGFSSRTTCTEQTHFLTHYDRRSNIDVPKSKRREKI